MVNLAVVYQRANYAVATLSAEVKARWGTPARAPEYVTGYKSASNLTGHNADSNGICHAVDLFFSNSSAWTEDRGWELAEWLRTVEGPRGVIPGYPDRMYYIIYRDRIAGDFSGWQWVGSGYGHWDHIHVSTCDMYWGDPAPIPAGDYDSKAPWGFASPGLASAGDTITPIQEDDVMNVEQERKLDSLVTLVSSLVDNVATKKDVASPGQVAFTEAALRSLVENVATKNDLSGVSAAVANAVGAKASVAEIEAAVRAGMTAGLKVDVIVGSQQ